ncbi:hypothetical protein BD413DRAFT_483955, partial [Trametes elegans]
AVTPWRGFRDLSETYGYIVHLNVLRNHIVVVGRAEVAHEFLNKRSANTSGRPTNPPPR